MIRCVIIDDEPEAIRILERYIEKVPDIELVGAATEPLAGVALAHSAHATAVFLDINMDEINGLEVIKLLPPATKVVLCTAFSEFAVLGYDLDIVDYLIKPVDFARFVRAVHRIAEVSTRDRADWLVAQGFIMVKTEQKGKLLKINLSDIDFIESRSNYVAFFHAGEITIAYLTLKDLEERLPPSMFMRVHKSYIVSLARINYIEHGYCVLKRNSTTVPVSPYYRETLNTWVKTNMIG